MLKRLRLAILYTFLFINLVHEIASHPTERIQKRDQAHVKSILKRALETNAPIFPTTPRPATTRPPFPSYTSQTGANNGNNLWTSSSRSVFTTQGQPLQTRPPQQQTTQNVWTSTTRPFFPTQAQWNPSSQRPANMISTPRLVALVEVQPKSNFSTAWTSTPTYPQWNASSTTDWWYYNSSTSTWYYPQWNSSTTDSWYQNYSTSTWSAPQWNASSTGWWYYNSSSSTWSSPQWYDNYTSTWTYPQWNASSTTDWWYYNSSSSTWYYPQWNSSTTDSWYQNYSTSTWTYPQWNTTYAVWNVTDNSTWTASKKNAIVLDVNMKINIQLDDEQTD